MLHARRPLRLAAASLFALSLLSACGEPLENLENDASTDATNFQPDATDSDTEPSGIQAAPGDLVPRFEPAQTDFYRMPWPSDARLSVDGRVDVSDLPHADDAFVAKYVDALRAVRGYSTMPVIYIPFVDAAGLDEDALDADALPSPQRTLEADSSVQLIDLSAENCGARTPLEVVFDAEGGKYIAAQTLKVAPMPGWVLRPATPYALIVTTEFGAGDQTTARTQLFADYLNGHGDNERLTASFEPLLNCLPQTELSADDIAIATVFHTQNPVAETRQMREVVWSDQTPVKDIGEWLLVEEASNETRKVYRGRAPFPIFQKGVPPYDTEGGLVFGEDGMPVIQRWESVPFLVVVPAEHPDPLNLLIWESGTGAVIGNSLDEWHWQASLANGFAIATFVPQFHEFRGEGNYDPIMDSFNYLNPVSGRTVFRQQAAETSYFIRFLIDKVVEKQELPTIKTDRIFYGGHSQGSLVGSLVAGVEPRIDTYVFSGVAAYLTETILARKEPFDIAKLLETLLDLDRPADRFHPMIQIAQTGADVVDAQNYAPFWAGWPGNPDGSNVLIINGKFDDTTSILGMNALMCAGEIPPVGTPGWDVDPYGLRGVQAYPLPVQGNREAFNGDPITIGAYLHPETGHFTLFDRQTASRAAVGFWESSAAGAAVIDY
jgi:hypothetical protein